MLATLGLPPASSSFPSSTTEPHARDRVVPTAPHRPAVVCTRFRTRCVHRRPKSDWLDCGPPRSLTPVTIHFSIFILWPSTYCCFASRGRLRRAWYDHCSPSGKVTGPACVCCLRSLALHSLSTLSSTLLYEDTAADHTTKGNHESLPH